MTRQWLACVSRLPTPVDGTELARAKDVVREDLVEFTDVLTLVGVRLGRLHLHVDC